MVRVTPSAVTSIVPVRDVNNGFAAAVTVNAPLPVRTIGLAESHELLLRVVHTAFDCTFTASLYAVYGVVTDECESISVPAAGCVTSMKRMGAPGALISIQPSLAVLVLFAVTLIVREPLPLRLEGVTVSHDGWRLIAVHVAFDVT